MTSFIRIAAAALFAGAMVALVAAQGRGPQSDAMRRATQAARENRTADALAAAREELQASPMSPAAASLLDALGATTEARTVFQRALDGASDPARQADARRAIAMSYAFDGNCAKTVEYEEMVIAYWKTREQAEPQNAFYQEGEMANEAARVCIDNGQLDVAEKYYRLGSELGLKEPAPKTHPSSLWDFRLTHALARLAARRGQAADAKRLIGQARSILDGDKEMAGQQERFFPYLVGYVALYTNDLPTAEAELTKAVAANASDPFMHVLLGMTYQKQGKADAAREIFLKAYPMAFAHNPPAAFTRPFVRKTLGL